MSQHVVVIGAVALGPKAASRFMRLQPDAKVTMIDQSDLISYGGCGIPYYVSGEVSEAMQLRTTTFHMLRDEQFFKDVKGVDAHTRVRADAIDRDAKTVRATRLESGESWDIPYDKLVIATGATPRKLGLPGEELDGVHYVSSPHDAVAIREAVSQGKVERAVVLGAGFIGLEMAEAFADMWGVETTVVEITDQLVPRLSSPVLARMAQRHMEEQGITFYFGESVKAFEGEGRVKRVITDKRTIEADVVVISVGVLPNSKLAEEAGLNVSERGGVLVDEHMRTNDPDIYAGGDCAIITNAVTGNPFFLPMGSMANRQGRIIGDNLAGLDRSFPPAVGSFVVKLFETSLAGAGLSLETARMSGFNAESVRLIQLDRAHFYPTKELMTLELVFDADTRKVLGIQGFGSSGDAMVGRINAVAGLLAKGCTIEDLSNLELCYSPPFSAAMDIVNTLANMADNALAGRNRGVGPEEFAQFWAEREGDTYHFIDCREEADARDYMDRNPDTWHNIPQGEIYQRLGEIPADKVVVLVCNTGARSYEAQIMLDARGRHDVINVHGGMAMLKKWGVDI